MADPKPTDPNAVAPNPAHAKKLQMGQSTPKPAKSPEIKEKTDGDAEEA